MFKINCIYWGNWKVTMHDQGKTQAQKNTWEYLKFTSQVDPWYGKSLQQSKQNKTK